MTADAFGVSRPDLVSKADDDPEPASAGRIVTGALFPGTHGAVAGKQGKKLKAAGHEVVGSAIAGPLGAGIGTSIAHDKGYYKPQKKKRDDVEKRDAFGVERVDLVSKSAGTAVVRSTRAGYHKGNLFGHDVGPNGPAQAAGGGGRTRTGRKRDASYRTTRLDPTEGQTRRGEFGRGFKGGLIGSSVARRAPMSTTNRPLKERRAMRSEYRSARDNVRARSGYKRAFDAGERTGRGTSYAVAHPYQVASGLTVAGAGANAAHDYRQAGKNTKVSKVSRGGALAIVGGAALGAQAGVNELSRRLGNKEGAGVSVREQYRHPIRSNYKINSAAYRQGSSNLKDAESRMRERAQAAKTPRRAEFHRLQADRAAEGANRYAHASRNLNESAKHGAIKARRAGKVERYDKTKKYEAPKEIGKSDAFGVPRPDLASR